MMEVILTSTFTIYRYQDKIEVYNSWDVRRERGLIISDADELDELVFLCKIFWFSKEKLGQEVVEDGCSD